ncbi:hypothetical protein Tco_1491990 [Tanacetum coccineum]
MYPNGGCGFMEDDDIGGGDSGDLGVGGGVGFDGDDGCRWYIDRWLCQRRQTRGCHKRSWHGEDDEESDEGTGSVV